MEPISWAQFLDIAGEPGQLPIGVTSECYRLWIDFESVDRTLIRMERPGSDGAAAGRFAYLSADAMCVIRAGLPLDARHWQCWQALLDLANFWEMPEQLPAKPTRPSHTPATARWRATLEASVRGHYRRVVRVDAHAGTDRDLFSLLDDFLKTLGSLALAAPHHYLWCRPDQPGG